MLRRAGNCIRGLGNELDFELVNAVMISIVTSFACILQAK